MGKTQPLFPSKWRFTPAPVLLKIFGVHYSGCHSEHARRFFVTHQNAIKRKYVHQIVASVRFGTVPFEWQLRYYALIQHEDTEMEKTPLP